MRSFFISLLALCCLTSLQATELSVSGRVLFGQSAQPLPDYEVNLSLITLDQFFSTVTDGNGAFIFEFEHDFGDDIQLPGTISVVDFCTGEVQFEAVMLLENFPSATDVELVVCGDVNPPPPPEHCEAFFSYEQISTNPFEVQFYDLSSTSEPVESWFWEFGDGNTSTGAAPMHTYSAPGAYEATLTITADTCEVAFTSTVYVDAQVPCDCDWNVFEPVCIEVAPGVVELFETLCYAECAGYSADDIVNCADNGFEFCEAFFVYEQGADSLSYLFYDNSFTYGDSIIAYEWLFPDGSTSNLQDPSFTFAAAGNYEVALTITTAGGCTVTFSQTLSVEGGSGGPCNCDDMFDPVCVFNDNGVIITLPSACVALCSGYGPNEIFEDCAFDDCGCPMVFEPVCVELIPGITFEFPNSCVAECEGYTEADFIDCGGNSGCDCPAVFDPVCVAVGNEVITFQNPCYAECEGYGPDQFTDCDGGGPCGCDDVFNPVCVVTPAGEILAFDNPCEATCLGFPPNQWVDCDDPGGCVCPGIFDPVCVVENGDTLTFENPCYAECEGYGSDQFVDCNAEAPCGCDLDILDPVCVATPSGQILTFQNPCLAECEGYDASVYFSCDEPGDCGCYQVYEPVCVTLPNGVELVFPNDCYAECEGYSPDQYAPCDGGGAGFCEATFEAIETDVPGQVQFMDYSYAPNDEITAWSWDFGDGATSTSQNPVHSYSVTGMVEVTLAIATADGCTSTTVQPVFIDSNGGAGNGPECQAMFSFEQDTDDLLSFSFTDMSMGSAVDSWFWSFGDGSSSTAQNPAYTYAAPGLYLVTLTITSGGCTSSMSMIILTDFDILYDEECLALFVPLKTDSLTYAFLNLSSNFNSIFEWDFGDGNTSTEPMPVHTYAEPGNYEVTLTLTADNGCQSTFTATINPTLNGFTGRPSFFMASSTTAERREIGEVRVYPNPASSKATLDLNLLKGGAYQLRLLNLNGQALWQQAYDWRAGQQQLDLNLSGLPNGLLILQVQGEKGVQTLRLLKQ